MKIKDWLKHFVLYLGILLALCLLEVIVLNPIIDFFGVDFYIHLFAYLLLFIVVNPLCTWLIAQKIIFIDKDVETLDE